jgi:hypothetical protein
MEINNLSYKFRLCTTLEEYTRALTYLDKISSYIEELLIEDVELIKRLKKGLLKQYRKYMTNIRQQYDESSFKGQKFIYKTVIDTYSKNLTQETISVIENFVNIINNLFPHIKDERLAVAMYHIRASLFVFLYEFSDEKSKYLELAFANYKKAVDISIKYLNNYDIIRIRLFYSYCKFMQKYLKDDYRSVLFCINVLDDMHKMKNDEELIEIITSNEFIKIEKKFKLFYENNLEGYNKTIHIYHPEYTKI